jgi:hypothetical protein
MGVLGALDILLYHMLAHGLRQRPESRAELVTHFLRGPTYAALFFAVPNLRLEGAWFVALIAVLVFDFAISIADFWLEPASRASDGGLRRGEYVLHVLLAMAFGALVYAVFDEGRDACELATKITWLDAGPPIALRVVLGIMSPLVLITGLLDLRAVIRLGRAQP